MRILILEDDPFIAFDLQAILEEEGHEVIGMFGSLAEAYLHLEDGFDCALLDVDVAGGKSFQIATALLEQQIPFAFVSASHQADLPRSLRQAAFVSKPFEKRMILQAIGAATDSLPACH